MSSEQRRPPAQPEPDEPRRLTDATAMRALAHPVRMQLLNLFSYHQTLTATQASELIGESPANCAFHLRTLAKYGYLKEAGGGRGRERPWTLASRSMNVSTVQDDPQATLAAEELSRAVFAVWAAQEPDALAAAGRLPGWEQASGYSLVNVFLTAGETEQLRAEIMRLLRRYEPRLADPALRPDGALPVEWTVFTTPVADWSPPPGGPAPAAPPDNDEPQ
jgi:hypothetical protein